MNRKIKKALILIVGLLIIIGIIVVIIINVNFKKETYIITIDANKEEIIRQEFGEKSRTTELYLELMSEGSLLLQIKDNSGNVILEKQVEDKITAKFKSEGDVSIVILSDKDLQVKIMQEVKLNFW